MLSRHDVSTVKPQGGYIAKQCPVRIQNDVLRPSEPIAIIAADSLMRMADGIAFEASVFEDLRAAAIPDWVFVNEDLDRAAAVSATVAAMETGAGLIAGGWLPVDEVGRRTGKPDLLIRVDGGYVPVDVKHHLTLSVEDDASTSVSPLSTPDILEIRSGWALRKNRDDVLQLAHYRRMLEASGFASSSMRAGILGKERVIVWYDLDEPRWQTPAKSDGKKRKVRTSMEIYDFEFGFRLDIAAVAQQSLAEEPVELLVEPVWSGGWCPECPWLEHCSVTFYAGSGDPSLLPGVGYKEWRMLRDHGITDRAGVAGLSYRTARLLTSKAELESAVDLDQATLAFGPAGFLANAIINARAVIGDLSVYRLPEKAGTDVPRADIELDVDMESTNDGVYLWGVLITSRANTGLVESGYLPFVTFDPIDSASEVEVFARFWRWMTNLMAQGAATGVSVNAYCWYAGAENTQMRRIAATDPELAAEVAAFIATPLWVDMYEVFKGSWITGDSLGLKAIAPLAGHTWTVDDPGGGLSMVKHVEATTLEDGDSAGEAARQWLLDYNRGDVEATLRIREWLDREGSSWPEVRAV
jgi:predicted RecB family nuclease